MVLVTIRVVIVAVTRLAVLKMTIVVVEMSSVNVSARSRMLIGIVVKTRVASRIRNCVA